MNSLATLCLSGLFESAHDETEFHRRHVPDDLILPIIYSKPFTIPPRRLLKQESSPELTLKLSLGERISGGRIGEVYRISIEGVFAKDGELASSVHVPPLVVKIAKRGYACRLAREAWFYDELKPLQGVATARCFGWFEARLPPNVTPIPWQLKPDENKHGFVFEDEEDEEDPQIVEDLRIKKMLGLQEPEGENSILSLLLLEELGGYLPMGKGFTKEIR